MEKYRLVLITLISCVLDSKVAFALEINGCDSGLGMETGEIADQDISASSSFDETSVGPQNSRIRTEKFGGAWCPKRQIRADVREWLEIDLRTPRVLTAIETQGRYGAGQGMEFAAGYMVEYWRPGMEGWARYKNRTGSEVIEGNANTFTAVVRQFDNPFVATKIRVIPWAEYTRTVCMRVEFYGCDYADRLLSYNMPQGYKGVDFDFRDKSYDGHADGRPVADDEVTLAGGLGQLFDGVLGHADFSKSPYQWVGWQQRLSGPHVDIVFEFKEPRNFTLIALHVSSHVKKDVRVFSKARLHFGYQPGVYSRTLLEYQYSSDRMKDTAGWIRIPTNGAAIGKYVKIQLFFASKWLLISELQFESLPVKGNVSYLLSESSLGPSEGVTSSGRAGDGVEQRVVSVGFDPNTVEESDTETSDEKLVTWDDMPQAYVTLIVGISVAIASICILIVVIIYIRHRKSAAASSSSLGASYAPAAYVSNFHNPQLYAAGTRTGDGKSVHVFYAADGSVKNRISDSGAMTFLNSNIEGDLLPACPPPKRPYSGTSPPPDYATASSIGNNQTITDEPSEYADPDSPMLLSSNSDIPLIPPPPSHKRRGSFRLPTFASFRCGSDLHSSTKDFHPRPSQSPSGDSLHYASSDVTTPPQEVAEYDWETNTAPSTSSAICISTAESNEIPRHRLQFREKLGEGEFGEVHLCFYDKALVAVKLLRKASDSISRQDFEKEMHTLSKFDHPNIVRLLGVCTKTEPWYTVVEYMEHGDLNQYLQRQTDPLPSNLFLHVSSQIAAGMRYLESLNVVHRDLATRNCLVGENLTIKLADFGMARSLYSSDYYRIEGRFVLPIRWMAWECILLGKFTPKSDVWAFGVTLWEILTLARNQPFSEMADETVIDNLQNMYHCGQLRVYLNQSPDCSQELYELMLACWRRDDDQRPTFSDIHTFLTAQTDVQAMNN